LVALSGGVDSAVACDVTPQGSVMRIETVYVKTWDHEDDLLGECPGAKDLKDARAVADKAKDSFSYT
jgi:tRNA U34 2-thiouridine synthase MnmA/TrmU